MGGLGELSGLDISVAASRPTGPSVTASRSRAERSGRPILHGSALLRAMGFDAQRDTGCRVGHPAPLREAALRGCSPLAGA